MAETPFATRELSAQHSGKVAFIVTTLSQLTFITGAFLTYNPLPLPPGSARLGSVNYNTGTQATYATVTII